MRCCLSFISIFSFSLLISLTVRGGVWTGSREVGYQSVYRFSDENIIRSRPYFILGQKFDTNLGRRGQSLFGFDVSARGWIDSSEYRNPADATSPNGRSNNEVTDELSLRHASAIFSSGDFRMELGLQEIHWGETFGFSVVDVVNPHDYRDPFFQDQSWTTVPVWAINMQWFIGKITLQGIFNPFPQSNLYPASNTVYDPANFVPGVQVQGPQTPDSSQIWGTAEYGGKASVLFDNGIDLGLIAYRHYNRNLLYTFTNPTTIMPVMTMTQTLGLSLSDSAGGWVFRGDSALHLNQPGAPSLLGLGEPIEGATESQTIIGTDYSGSHWMLGFQLQNDSYFSSNSQLKLFWGSSKIRRDFFKNKLQLEAFVFLGIDNSDQWYQPKITWNANSSVSLSLTADFIYGGTQPGDGYLANITGQNRMSVWLLCHI